MVLRRRVRRATRDANIFLFPKFSRCKQRRCYDRMVQSETLFSQIVFGEHRVPFYFRLASKFPWVPMIVPRSRPSDSSAFILLFSNAILLVSSRPMVPVWRHRDAVSRKTLNFLVFSGDVADVFRRRENCLGRDRGCEEFRSTTIAYIYIASGYILSQLCVESNQTNTQTIDIKKVHCIIFRMTNFQLNYK